MNQTKLLFPLIFISLEDEPWEPIEPNPNAAPAEEPVAAEPGLSESDWTLASTETVTHEKLMNRKRAKTTQHRPKQSARSLAFWPRPRP